MHNSFATTKLTPKIRMSQRRGVSFHEEPFAGQDEWVEDDLDNGGRSTHLPLG
jgi:hypothetical protein